MAWPLDMEDGSSWTCPITELGVAEEMQMILVREQVSGLLGMSGEMDGLQWDKEKSSRGDGNIYLDCGNSFICQ